jgi:rare lipoprotein A
MQKLFAIAICATLLAGCATPPVQKATTAPAAKTEVTAPAKGGYLEGDGPGVDAPANLETIPDAVPRNEKLHRYANSPYVALGKAYTPLTKAGDFTQRGIASWYGKKFHGQPTSSGEKYDMYAMSAAHPTLPIPSYARVTNLANQKSVVVRINDRGPFMHDRVIDLSYVAAHKLGIISNGSAEVEVESLNSDVVITPIAPSEPIQSTPLESVTPPVVEAVPAVVPVETVAASQSTDTNIYLQLGAFKTQENAEAYLAIMRRELGETDKQLRLTSKGELTRVQLGPYGSEAEARSSAAVLEGKLGFKPMVNLP